MVIEILQISLCVFMTLYRDRKRRHSHDRSILCISHGTRSSFNSFGGALFDTIFNLQLCLQFNFLTTLQTLAHGTSRNSSFPSALPHEELQKHDSPQGIRALAHAQFPDRQLLLDFLRGTQPHAIDFRAT